MRIHMGLDVGSTTVKLVVLDQNNHILHRVYTRHKSNVEETTKRVLREAYHEHPKFQQAHCTICVTGSGGMFVEKYLEIEFVQEVVAGTIAIRYYLPDTDVSIELGGEDSKITYLSGNIEQRMNSICAGGTGAFIDQMASLLETDASGLNELATSHKKIYSIASRCGVFAKTDLQALMNQGATKPDMAASVFQSVVNQTISNLACGRPIEGNVALIGGPLHFLSALQDRFIETLNIPGNRFYIPENSEIFVALGAALASKESDEVSYEEILRKCDREIQRTVSHEDLMEPLFKDAKEQEEFAVRHAKESVSYGDIKTYEGDCYLGIDAGSTTSKIVVMGEDNRILYDYYANNMGRPLEVVRDALIEIYEKLHPKAKIVSSGITGYGEDFIRAAFGIDHGEVETIAHYTAAKFFDSKVDFILDIGGQDMKAMHITEGVIDSIQLNEACSSGCGSFIETFSKSLGMDMGSFQSEAMKAKKPVDLGSRCTVFMNSSVKQAQKEGASVGDIAAGLCYSVIKNAIQKVIKVRDPEKLGTHIVVQGGTFYGDATLRAFEKITGKDAIRPSIAGLMGALGMAIIAKDRATGSSEISDDATLKQFTYVQENAQCKYCSNHCNLSINQFSNGTSFISGNRCERGAGVLTKDKNRLPNLYAYKNKRLFGYKPLSLQQQMRGTVGIPRVLNMYENYPFWFTFFTKLGYRVVLSQKSSRRMYEKGISSITSETACYPAKISHGHIESLLEKDVDMIFYPSIFYEKQEFNKADNHMNCPVVAGYSEVIKNNIDLKNTEFKNPFLSLQDKNGLKNRLAQEFEDIPKKEIYNAVDAAWKELDHYREDVKVEGARALAFIKEQNVKAIVLAGRPYHIDEEIHHGIPELITSLGMAVLSEDAIVDSTEDLSDELRVLDQWVYHSRLYRAAEFVGQREDMELIQLNSFGCGIDAVTTDQVNEILRQYGKIYTVLKIDEISNLGAVKIRIRSLIQALDDRKIGSVELEAEQKPVSFTKEMRKDYTILAPQMAPDHFEIMEKALEEEGYHFEFLKKVNSKVIDEGLKYVNNDSCYPSITVVGQMMEAIKSGKYDVNKLALVMTQTGGACRASNYVGYIRKALKEAGYPQIPVIALSAQGIETNDGFKMTPSLIQKIILSVLYGDLIMRLSNEVRPYEKKTGKTDHLKEYWKKKCQEAVCRPKKEIFKQNVKQIIESFDKIERVKKDIPRVGIVGEILVKYLPQANNNLQNVLEKEGCEAVLPDLTDFFMYCLRNAVHKKELLSKGRVPAFVCNMAIKYIESYRNIIRKELEQSRFTAPLKIQELETLAAPIVSLGNQYGEGWLLTAEMIELIEQNAPNIVCIQPFGCLPNHITGKGVIKKIRETHPQSNIVAIDYDPGASEVNQINRIKLMLSSAKEKVKKEQAPKNKVNKSFIF